jgi:hypothetical protein
MGTPIHLTYFALDITRKGKVLHAVVTSTWADGRKSEGPVVHGFHETEAGAKALAAEWTKIQPMTKRTN